MLCVCSVNCLLCPLTVGASVHMLPKMEAATAWSLLTTRESQVYRATEKFINKIVQRDFLLKLVLLKLMR